MSPDPALAAAAVRRGSESATVGLILGSGLGDLAEQAADPWRTPYADIPGMPLPTVAGHAGELVLGRLGGQSVALMCGRVHMYEGHSAAAVSFSVRVLHALGCRTLIATNAAGGINSTLDVGDLMAILDHVFLPGLAGANPLVGGASFVSMAGAYDADLIRIALSAAGRLDFELKTGVYAMVSGPSFETSAELRLLRAVGADAVGMSTAPEVVVARQLGMRVLAISAITNRARPDDPLPVDHQAVLAVGALLKPRFSTLIGKVLESL